SMEYALYELFQHDARIPKLRDAVDQPRDLPSAAQAVFGRSDEHAVEWLCGLVRVASLARMPGSDARLVPCRYHLFCRGLNGAYLTLDRREGGTVPILFLDPVREASEGGSKTLELRACRKCGQPYLFGYHYSERGELRAFGAPMEGRGAAHWLVWEDP